MNDYTSIDEARAAARAKYEADHPVPTKPTLGVLERAQVVRVGTGRLWLEVEPRYSYRAEPEVNLHFTGRNDSNAITLEEVEALIAQLHSARHNYDAMIENNRLEREYNEALKRWEEARDKAERRAIAAFKKAKDQATVSGKENEELA